MPATLEGHDAPLKMDALGDKDSEAAGRRDLMVRLPAATV